MKIIIIIISKMDRNPNTVEYFGIFENNGDRYLVLELLNSSLSHYLESTTDKHPIDKLIKL